VNVTLVLDFIHVTEYVWAAAWDLFKEGDAAAEGWVRRYLRQILEGRASTVAAAIRRSATCRKLEKRTNIDKAAQYLLGHIAMLRYDEFLRDGLPIATGVIEGACRERRPCSNSGPSTPRATFPNIGSFTGNANSRETMLHATLMARRIGSHGPPRDRRRD